MPSPPPEFTNDRLEAFQPFSVGPTNCIGKLLAWSELRLFAARFLWLFRVEIAEGHDFLWESQRKMMVIEKNPLWMKLERRDMDN